MCCVPQVLAEGLGRERTATRVHRQVQARAWSVQQGGLLIRLIFCLVVMLT